MAVMPVTYSPATIERSFKIIDEFTVAGLNLAIIFDEATPRASIINMAAQNFDGSLRHQVVAMLDLQRRKTIGDNVIEITRFWEDEDFIAQIEGVVVLKELQSLQLATRLYETLVNDCNLILMSDNEQYEGGKALWKKIARDASTLSVFILDTDNGKFYPYDGDRIRYDGKSIPEEKIWCTHPDRDLWGIVLVAESKQRLKKIAA